MALAGVEALNARAGEDLWAGLAERLGEEVAGRAAAFLVGSAVAGFADGYSRPDVLVVLPRAEAEAAAERLGLPLGAWARVRAGAASGKVCVTPVDDLERALAAHEDEALFLLQSGTVLRDPAGEGARLARRAAEVPEVVWQEKARAAYQAFRQRKASLAWALRRGQPFVCLDNLTRLVALALRLCYYLAGKPPANAKWLFQGAMRTPVGREIRPLVLELLGSLGEVSVLGGSYTLRHNAVYAAVTRLQRALEAALGRHGAGGRPDRGEAE